MSTSASANAPAASVLAVTFNRANETCVLVDQLLTVEGMDILVAADGPSNGFLRVKSDVIVSDRIIKRFNSCSAMLLRATYAEQGVKRLTGRLSNLRQRTYAHATFYEYKSLS